MGLTGLLQGYLGWLRVTRAILMHYQPIVSVSQDGRPMRKFLGGPVEGYPVG
jgi:hypothetical protein